jgi:hypothetical protein
LSAEPDEIAEVRERISRALWGIKAPLEGLGHAHTRIDANSAEFITQTILDALGLERVECRFCGFADDGPCEDGQEHAYLWLIQAAHSTEVPQ